MYTLDLESKWIITTFLSFLPFLQIHASQNFQWLISPIKVGQTSMGGMMIFSSLLFPLQKKQKKVNGSDTVLPGFNTQREQKKTKNNQSHKLVLLLSDAPQNLLWPLSCVWPVRLVVEKKLLSPPAAARGRTRPWTSFLWGRWRKRRNNTAGSSLENSNNTRNFHWNRKKNPCVFNGEGKLLKQSAVQISLSSNPRSWICQTYYLSDLSHAKNATVLICNNIHCRTNRGPHIPFEFKRDCGKLDSGGGILHTECNVLQSARVNPRFNLPGSRWVGEAEAEPAEMGLWVGERRINWGWLKYAWHSLKEEGEMWLYYSTSQFDCLMRAKLQLGNI